MNTKQLLLLSLALLAARLAGAQGTAFTYQGRLAQNGALPTGIYDMRFTLHDTLAGVPQVGGPLSNPTVGVSNGLFTVTLDFGVGAFNGSPRWLQIGVRTNGSAATHTPLSPRQPVTAAPYAVLAGNVTGNISDGQLSANVARLNGNQIFTGLATFNPPSGAPFGVGANANKVSNLNADLLDGLDSGAFWKLGGNSGTTPGTHYIGASDNAQVRFHAMGGLLVDDATPGLSFGATRRQMLNLWTAQFGLGIQDFTLYQRSDNQFNWFRGGSHANGVNDPGTGGLLVMNLDSAGSLFVNSSLVVDRTNANNGGLYPGVIFAPGSGEGISSKRTATGNQYGLDFYTSFQNRLSILNDGRVGVATQQPEHSLDVNGNLAARGSLLVNSKDQQDGTYPELPGILFGDFNSGEVITSQRGTNGPNRYGLDFYTGYGRRLSIANNGNVGIGTATPAEKLHVAGNFIRVEGGGNEQAYLGGDGVGNNIQVGSMNSNIRTVELFNTSNGLMDVVARDASVRQLTIRGGADLAEPFQMSQAEIAKGSLVIIDEDNPGKLKQSAQAYDTRVAGIISGANGVNAGITLQQEGLLEGGQNVALSGRVYALADASSGAIKPGDLLTSSATPGHVMRVSDHARGHGAIVGKAMSALNDGKGMVLVLVSLQ